MDLESSKEAFEGLRKEIAEPAEERSMKNLILTAQRSIDRNENDFDKCSSFDKQDNGNIVPPRLVYYRFLSKIDTFPVNYYDVSKFLELKRLGDQVLLVSGDIKTNLENNF